MDRIRTEGLTKGKDGSYRVKDIALRVPEGCVYGFLGPNGAGKTTTLKLLLGLIRPDGGRIFYDGEEMTKKNGLKLIRRTGSLIESPGFYGHLTGFENMEIVARLKGVSADEVRRKLSLVRLSEQQDKPVKHFSLGMKQRLGIAMALLGDPEILFLDEPTNGLDPAGIQEMRSLIRSLPRERGMTVVVSSHLLSEVEQMADEVGIIARGEMVFQGPMSALDLERNSLEEVFLELTGSGESL